MQINGNAVLVISVNIIRNVYDENANFLNEKPIDSFLYSIAMSYGATNPRDRYIDFVKELTEPSVISHI